MTNLREFKSFIGIPGGSEIQRCFYPLKIDSYGRGCLHNCVYCYSRATMQWRKMWDAIDPAVTDFAKISEVFNNALSNKKKGLIYDLIRMKYPVRLGGNTDCFTETDLKYSVSLNLLRLLKDYKHPYLILTKGDIIARPEYLKALDPELAHVQFSITTPHDEWSSKFEPGAPVTSKRLQAAKILSEHGITVAGRICPIIPNYPDGYYSEGLYQDVKPLDYFGWELVDMMKDAGCKTIIAGFLRLNYYNNNRKHITNEIGFDLDYLFSPEIRKQNDALYFSIEEKRYYYEKLQKLAHEKGMRFSVCYDGDEAYTVFQYLWENPNDCCDTQFTRPADLFKLKAA